MDCKRDMHSPERSKRKLKTPAQLEALEEFYRDHKYPSESMKLQFAKQIRLSEKQVSGWFCHRRLKDKRLLQSELCAKGKQNLPCGAIHDLSTGLRQESCNSTKQGNRHYDSKEIESKRFDDHYSPVASSASEKRGRASHVECYTDAAEISSESSTASHERFFKQGVKHHAMKLNYAFCDANLRFMDRKAVKTRGYKDPGSLCPENEVESPAISSVKLKLGRRYCEDGPPLAVVFDVLPPGAFDSPVGDSNCGPYYVGDSFQLRSCNPPLIVKEPKMYDQCRSETVTGSMFPEGSSYSRNSGFHHQNDYSRFKLTPVSSIAKSNDHIKNQTLIMDDPEVIAGEVSDLYKTNNGRLFMQREGEPNNSSRYCFPKNDQRAYDSKPLPYSLSHCKYGTTKETLGVKISQPAPRSKGFLVIKDKVQPRRSLMVLSKKIDKEERTHKLYNSVRPEVLMSNDAKFARKVPGIEFKMADFMTKGSENFPHTKQIVRLRLHSHVTLVFIFRCQMPVRCDNRVAIHISDSPVVYGRTKHIEIDCYFVRDEVF